MKNTVMLPFVFFINLLLWTLGIAFFSVFASQDGMAVLTAGTAGVFAYECLYRAVYYLPVSISLSLISVFFFLMRHRTLFWLTGGITLVLVLFSVFVLMPFSYRWTEDHMWSFVNNRSLLNASPESVFSPGIIHSDDTGLRGIWFSVSEGGGRVNPLLLAQTGTNTPVLTVYPEAAVEASSGSLLVGNGQNIYRVTGSDPLFVNVLTPPVAVVFVHTRVAQVMNAFLRSFREGFSHYVFFSGAFFVSVVLISLVCHATGWRLLNILFSIIALLYLFAIYPSFSEGSAFLFIKRLAPSTISADLLPSVLYLVQAVLFSLIAGFVFLRRLLRQAGQGSAP